MFGIELTKWLSFQGGRLEHDSLTPQDLIGSAHPERAHLAWSPSYHLGKEMLEAQSQKRLLNQLGLKSTAQP